MSVNKSVLVISESQRQFSLAANLLRAEGYKVSFAGNINKSLKIVDAEPPQLIISELAMPDIDGLQICKQFRSDYRMCQTPILLVGDLSENSSIVKDSRRCGASDYVQKPFTFKVLTAKVMELLEARPMAMSA